MDTGNTVGRHSQRKPQAVQPRGYGEHAPATSIPSFNAGSAPWIRGTHVLVKVFEDSDRFSPVDTGNTSI